MTSGQQYLNDRHIERIEENLAKIEAAGFVLTELAEWYGGQPNTEFKSADGRHVLRIYGFARCGLFTAGGTKIDACKLSVYNPATLDRVLARTAS